MPSNHPTRVPDVSVLPCLARNVSPAKDLPHQIENRGSKPPACVYCLRSWADLDEELRATLPNHGRDPV